VLDPQAAVFIAAAKAEAELKCLTWPVDEAEESAAAEATTEVATANVDPKAALAQLRPEEQTEQPPLLKLTEQPQGTQPTSPVSCSDDTFEDSTQSPLKKKTAKSRVRKFFGKLLRPFRLLASSCLPTH
jgi:hypothetical protein